MLQSILNDDIQFLKNKNISKNDIGATVSVYEVELFDVKTCICIGEIVDTFIDKMVYYCPVYLIIEKTRIEKIGYFEFYREELSIVTDKGGEIDISLLEGPLLFDYIDADYLINIIKSGDFLKKFSLEEEEFNKISLKSKNKRSTDAESKRSATDAKAEGNVESKRSASDAKADAKADGSDALVPGVYEEVNDIPNISIIKDNGEKKFAEKLNNHSSKKYLEDIKLYNGNNDNWLQGHFNNNNFTIQNVEANGDCFFATLREAFKTLGVDVNVKSMRKILSTKVTKAQFEFNKTIYKDTYSSLKQYRSDYQIVKKNVQKNTQKIKELLKQASKEKSDRIKIKSIGEKRDKINASLLKENAELKQLHNAFTNTKIVFKSKQWMKGVSSFKDYLKIINTSDYWADEMAISIMEFVFNIKVIILSKERFDSDENIFICGTSILKPIEKRQEFNPKYYIIVSHTGNHYKLIKYKEKSIFTFYEIPHIIKENLKRECPKSLFNYIPLFKTYFENK